MDTSITPIGITNIRLYMPTGETLDSATVDGETVEVGDVFCTSRQFADIPAETELQVEVMYSTNTSDVLAVLESANGNSGAYWEGSVDAIVSVLGLKLERVNDR